LFPDFFSPLVTIPVAPVITGVTKPFMFHIHWIYILEFLYFNLFSDSFCITFLSDGIATSISKQILSFLFLIIMKLESIQRKFVALCYTRFFNGVCDYKYEEI
jgi:hypothetical protein